MITLFWGDACEVSHNTSFSIFTKTAPFHSGLPPMPFARPDFPAYEFKCHSPMPWVTLSTPVDVQNETVTAFPDITYSVVSQPSIRWLLVNKSGNQRVLTAKDVFYYKNNNIVLVHVYAYWYKDRCRTILEKSATLFVRYRQKCWLDPI